MCPFHSQNKLLKKYVLEIVFTFSIWLHMDTTFEGVCLSVLGAFFSTRSYSVDINSKPLIIHPLYLLENTQYLCKYMVFPYALIELYLYCLGAKNLVLEHWEKIAKETTLFP